MLENDHFPSSIILCLLIPLFFVILAKLNTIFTSNPTKLPKSNPIFGSFFTILKNRETFIQWTSQIVTSTPNLTFNLHLRFGLRLIITANAANVRHILKSHFHNYGKGDYMKNTFKDILGDGIFNTDGESWKFQRQVSSHEFSTKSLRDFVENVVSAELSDRLIPILTDAAENKTVLDFQDILERFAFDNICRIAFNYDPKYLSPSLSQEQFAVAFGNAVKLSMDRLSSFIPDTWKIKRALNIGSEKHLKIAVDQVREFAKEIIRKKKTFHDDDDLLSRFLSSGHDDEDFVIDIVISFILAGKDTTSAALTWFFWLLSNHPGVESEIINEINELKKSSAYDEAKDMVYTHASLCESMRLYPPVPLDTKTALKDDVLPDGTAVKKGTRVSYHPYAMGRVESVWGPDWAEFRPERWLDENREFVSRDAFVYTVFQAGPRVCLGKEMAFIQMKSVVAGVLRRFRVVPVAEEAVYVADLTAKMKGGLPVRIELRR